LIDRILSKLSWITFLAAIDHGAEQLWDKMRRSPNSSQAETNRTRGESCRFSKQSKSSGCGAKAADLKSAVGGFTITSSGRTLGCGLQPAHGCSRRSDRSRDHASNSKRNSGRIICRRTKLRGAEIPASGWEY
jgi:hypothetical protein